MEDDWFSDPDDMRMLAVGVISDTFVQLSGKSIRKKVEARAFVASVGFELWTEFTSLNVDYLRWIARRIDIGELSIKRQIEWVERPDATGMKPWMKDVNERRKQANDSRDQCCDEVRPLRNGEALRVGT